MGLSIIVKTRWKKLGLLFEPDRTRWWMRSHAACPCTLALSDDVVRVYFSSRDAEQRSHTGWVEIDTAGDPRVVRVSSEPVLAPGPLGHFDDHGVYGSAVAVRGDSLLMYYVGWNPGKRDPMFYASIGLAVSRDGGLTFEKYSSAPILARSEVDPWMVSACCVRAEEDRFRMWYISGIGWEARPDGELLSRYHVKYAESHDGIHWKRNGKVALPLVGNETNITRPSVIRYGGRFEAWFGVHAGSGYRIGHAQSPDGDEWTRIPGALVPEPSDSGWDSEAVTYPWVFRSSGRMFMLYNGNGFGRDGFGIAERVDD